MTSATTRGVLVFEQGWSMYHGDTVPGFPAHPHRGFETITVTRKGMCDHADSMGCAGRFGEGDTQVRGWGLGGSAPRLRQASLLRASPGDSWLGTPTNEASPTTRRNREPHARRGLSET